MGLSGGDLSLAKKCKFRTFKRRERRYLLNLLENSPHLEEDIYRHKNVWKKLMFALHPGDYYQKFPRVIKAYNKLYNNLSVTTFNSQLELYLQQQDIRAIELLKTAADINPKPLDIRVLFERQIGAVKYPYRFVVKASQGNKILRLGQGTQPTL